MLLKRFYDDYLAQASYLIGCPGAGQALVIDPARDITPYVQAAEKEGLRITYVTETHIHADYVSGARELAAATGASLHLSAMGGADWQYAFPHVPLRAGDSWRVGAVKVDVIHTPGHTPEHLVFAITDTAGADRPMLLVTGDFLFVGDVGRPDLLETAAGVAGSKEIGAQQQFTSIERFKTFPDYLQVLPGHGAGSACGKALGGVPSTTLGYEKLFNPAFQFSDADAFSAWLLDGQPEPPRYFGHMKYVNRAGPPPLRDLMPPEQGTRANLDVLLATGAQVFDLRSQEAFAAAHVAGTVSVPATSNAYITHIGWLVDYTQSAYFILPDGMPRDAVLTALRAIGVDDVPLLFDAAVIEDGPTDALPGIRARELALVKRSSRVPVLHIDVRGRAEYDAQHIQGAQHVPLGYLRDHVNDLPHDGLVVLNCASGYRSHIATSVLRALGFTNATNLIEDEAVWAGVFDTDQTGAVRVE
jgi:hydroxyacylglutathione hydrolase